ncbi:MAG: hypothetical protein AMJ84_00315 [Acidithiobacillales bacterium SM23_46]|nr:MAG: hypothetical protein AMJ84_00315 [Acidithiobacillales bacterium SM23_46]KPL29002.1 MAG: hypothetical protein AMJ72_00135 [Acidithiobacillales bacterium SM1_46]
MIDRSDEKPRFVIAQPAPTHIAFMAQGEEVGRMYLEDPLRFEGRADCAAQVFFNHVVNHHLQIRELLMRYIRHVGNCEGVDFISRPGDRRGSNEFTDDQWAKLEALAREAWNT